MRTPQPGRLGPRDRVLERSDADHRAYRAKRQRPSGVRVRHLRYWHAPAVIAQVPADVLGLPLQDISINPGDSSLPRSPSKADHRSRPRSPMGSAAADAIREGAVPSRRTDAGLATRGRSARRSDARGQQADEQGRRVALGVDHGRHAARGRGPHRTGGNLTPAVMARARATRTQRFRRGESRRAARVIRVTRVVSAIAAGRILNTKTASSQILGGVVWGVGMALHEETLIDHGLGRIMNANIAEYHVPVNADINDIKSSSWTSPMTAIHWASRGSAKSALLASRRRS